jgi:hypothetical protein
MLTPATGRAGLAPDCSESVGTVPLWTFHMLGQGCWSQDRGLFLWMAVQKCGGAIDGPSRLMSVIARLRQEHWNSTILFPWCHSRVTAEPHPEAAEQNS